MDQIGKGRCTEVGFIQKPHGLKGEVILIFDSQFEEIAESFENYFVEINGGLVPFFVSEDGVKYRSNESLIIKFDYIDNQDKAKEISGSKVFIPNDDLSENDSAEDYHSLIGMKVIDEKEGELGLITALDDFSGNIVITVAHPRSEILIPLSDEIIRGIDEKNKQIYLECPEGLIDIYLD
jgi:16S rRNA processing protein RimM